MRAARILGARTDRIPLMIQELCEERADVLLSAPTHASRRRSAPSPRLVPINPHQVFDFRTWAAANGSIPMYGPQLPRSHQLAPSPLDETAEPVSPTTLTQGTTVFPPPRQHYPPFPPPRQQQAYRRRTQGPPSGAASPRLERRMSWDGTAANFQDQQTNNYAPPGRSASVTAPESPNLVPNFFVRSQNAQQFTPPYRPSIVFGNFSAFANDAEAAAAQSSSTTDQQQTQSRSSSSSEAASPATSSTTIRAQEGARGGGNEGLGLFEGADDEQRSVRRSPTTGMIRPDVDGETITFGAIRVVRRREEGDRLMAARLRGSVRDSGEEEDSSPKESHQEEEEEKEEFEERHRGQDGGQRNQGEEEGEGDEGQGQGDHEDRRGVMPRGEPSTEANEETVIHGSPEAEEERLPNGMVAEKRESPLAEDLEGLRIRERVRRGVRRSA
jgi:hypothetical protein